MRSRLVAGLDIGSTKTAAVIAEVGTDSPRRPRVKVLGVGQVRTTGIRREVVTAIEATTETVRKAVGEAELMAGVSVDQALYRLRRRAHRGTVFQRGGCGGGGRDLDRGCRAGA